VAFLQHLRRHVRGKLVILWDGATTHRAVIVRERAQSYGWKLERLPAYSPDLNPVEGWWGWMKGGPLANFGGDTLGEVGAAVRAGTRRVQRRPNLISAFLEKTGLSL
jgi:putative transposase